MKAMAHEQSKTSAHKCLQRLKVDFEAVFVSILLPLSLSARLLRKHSSFKSSTQQPSGNRCTQKPTIKKKKRSLEKAVCGKSESGKQQEAERSRADTTKRCAGGEEAGIFPQGRFFVIAAQTSVGENMQETTAGSFNDSVTVIFHE